MVETHAVATPGGPPEPAVRARAILVIEDEPRIRRAIRDALHDVADRVLEAGAGRRGRGVAAPRRPPAGLRFPPLPARPRGEGAFAPRRGAPRPVMPLPRRPP